MQSSRSRFEAWAPTYELSVLQTLVYEPVHETVLALLQEHARAGGRALDVGCGTGRLISAAQELIPVVVGADVSARMLARARCLRAGPSFVCAVAEELPFASGSFDVVTTTLSLRHWHDPNRGVRELFRVLSPEGVMVVADADFEEEEMRARQRWHFRQARGGQLAVLLARSGMRVVDYRLAPVRGPVPSVHVLVARRRYLAKHRRQT